MIKKLCLIFMITLLLLTNSFDTSAISYTQQQNTALTYKEAMIQLSKASGKHIEQIIISDKLSTKKYNYIFDNDITQFNYLKLQSTKEHTSNNELRVKWIGFLKVDYGNELIIYLHVTELPEEELLKRYDFKTGAQGYDLNGDDVKGYYNNINYSSIVEFKNKQDYSYYDISHSLYFSFY